MNITTCPKGMVDTCCENYDNCAVALTAQRTEQESVADDFFRMIADRNPKPFPPPQRTWVGLTDEEAQWLYDNCRTPSNLIDMVEAKLKEKNT